MRIDNFNINILPDNELPYRMGHPDPYIQKRDYFDDNNIPLFFFNGRHSYHPAYMIQYAFNLLDSYLSRGSTDAILFKRIIVIAEKIKNIGLCMDDRLWLPYNFNFAGHEPEPLVAPWYSGMSQGQALSFFSRLFKITKDEKYLILCKKLFRTLSYIRKDKEILWVSYIDENNYFWIEEDPIDNEKHILNGFIFAIYGLYDYFLLTKADTENLLQASLTTVKNNVESHRVIDGLSYYCIQHKVQNEYYHKVHISQMLMLYKITGDIYFKNISELLTNDHAAFLKNNSR
jgi:hypothetical protein